MQGKVFLLALLVTSIAANAHLSRFFEVQYPTDLSLQKEQFDRIEENNCGSMLGKAMKDVTSGAERYTRVAEKFATAESVDCRAVILNSFTLVRLNLEDEVETCSIIVPLNTLALHHKDSPKYPHVEKAYADLLAHYNTCTLKPIQLPESGEDEEDSVALTPEQITGFAAGYTTYNMSAVEVNTFHLDEQDAEALRTYVENPKKIVNDLAKVANLTKEGIKIVTTKLLEKFTPQQVEAVTKSADFTVAAFAAADETDKKNDAKVDEDEDIKFVYPSQFGETARECNDTERAQMHSLYVGASIDGRVRPYGMSDENVTQCIVDGNGMRLKALIAINSFRCVFNLSFENNKLQKFTLQKTEDPLLAEHGIHDCNKDVIALGN